MNNGKEREHQKALLRLQATQEELREHLAVIEKNERRLAALNAISGLVTQAPEIGQFLTLVAQTVIELMDVDVVLLFLLDDESQELFLEVHKGVSAEFVAGVKRMKVGEGFNGTVAQTGRPLVVEDATTNPLLSRQVVLTERIRSQLIVPLQCKGKVVGTLCVAKRMPGKFYPDETELLGSIGNQIGAGLENARLYQEMSQALRQLRQSEERYRDLFENAYDAIWVHDSDGNQLATNKACEKLTGYSSDELTDVSICQLMSEWTKSCVSEIEHRLLQGKPVEHCCDGELFRKEGGKALVQVTTSLIAPEGQAVGIQHCARDVTDERQLQENLRYYLQQVTRAQEEERKRIARELHDETLQNLVAISRQLDKITSSDALWEESHEAVRSFKKQVEVAVHEIRRFSHDLRPSVLDDLRLLPALELLSDDLEKQGIATSFKVIGEARRLMPEVEVMLFRIAQEAMRNLWRHAQASVAELSIEFGDATVRVSINDNGGGFRLPRRPEDLASLGKLGLAGMHERARLVGGILMLKSRQGKGTAVTVEVPV